MYQFHLELNVNEAELMLQTYQTNCCLRIAIQNERLAIEDLQRL